MKQKITEALAELKRFLDCVKMDTQYLGLAPHVYFRVVEEEVKALLAERTDPIRSDDPIQEHLENVDPANTVDYAKAKDSFNYLKQYIREERHAYNDASKLISSLTAENKQLRAGLMEKTFPVMLNYHARKELSDTPCPTSVPWLFVAQFDRTVKRFHEQTLERLAQRGGLSPCELMAVITNNRAWWQESERKAVEALKTRVDTWRKETL